MQTWLFKEVFSYHGAVGDPKVLSYIDVLRRRASVGERVAIIGAGVAVLWAVVGLRLGTNYDRAKAAQGDQD